MDKPAQIALLIDADNATASRIDVILGELSRLGETNVRRAYGNWTKTGLKSWQEVLHENAIRPVQQFDPSKGKNASDIALAVDAVEILHTQRPDAFALVSSDADFTPLVMHLREHGAHVYGFGDAKTPAAVPERLHPLPRAQPALLPQRPGRAGPAGCRTGGCRVVAGRRGGASRDDPATGHGQGDEQGDRDDDGQGHGIREEDHEPRPPRRPRQRPRRPPRAPTPARATRAQLRGDRKLVALLRRAVEGAADDSGWALVGTVGNHISNQSSFDPRNYGYAKLSKLLEATDLFDMRDSGGPAMAVRDRRGGAGTSTNGTTGGNP